MTKKEKFLALVSQEETKTLERAKARLAKKSYTKISGQIAFEILERLDELQWKQKDLAEKMGVSPQQVNKWVKGNENFTLETLGKLSEVLGIELIQVPTMKDTKLTAESKCILNTSRYESDYVVFYKEYSCEATAV
ncbi:helix-turn-helix transcriptional regulator [Sphingobacterium thermophilum]|uniref:HTH cro/C1-type domain-containing protein n=1 Tax=Sphingobacterium thermophilum TaxID=768534 RepID=A0ABP8QWD4_9SPHI